MPGNVVASKFGETVHEKKVTTNHTNNTNKMHIYDKIEERPRSGFFLVFIRGIRVVCGDSLCLRYSDAGRCAPSCAGRAAFPRSSQNASPLHLVRSWCLSWIGSSNRGGTDHTRRVVRS